MQTELRKIQFRNEVSNRKFGFTIAAILTIWGVWLMVRKNDAGLYLGTAAGLLAMITIIAPNWLSIPNKLWYLLGLLLQSIVSPVVLFVIFCLLIIPVGLIRKVAGKNTIKFKFNSADSNWTEVSRKWNEDDFKHLF